MKRIKLSDLSKYDDAFNVKSLCEWYANIFRVENKQYLIFSEIMSLYSVIVPLKGITNRVQLEIAFKKEIESIVLKNNIGKNKIDLNEILILATNNKSVVGSQVELIRMAKYIYIDCGYFDLENINGTPMSIHKSFPDLEFNKFIKSIKGKEKDF